jgi:hypothetical protein
MICKLTDKLYGSMLVIGNEQILQNIRFKKKIAKDQATLFLDCVLKNNVKFFADSFILVAKAQI